MPPAPALRKRLLLALLAPALALLALEGGLRAAGYGFTPRLLVQDPRTGLRVTNPDYGRLYFPRALARQPEPIRLADPKPAGEYRLFILGESAALGMPDPAYGFGRQLEVMLRTQAAGRRVVVANLAMTAINSHALPGLAAEALDAGADALVVLAGNNEVVGPFGPGTVFDGAQPSRAAVRAKLWLRGTRVGQLLAAVRERTGAPGAPSSWGGLAMFLDHRVAADDPRLARTYASFRANLRAVLGQAGRRRVPVLLCTVPVNLRDCPPFADDPAGSAGQAYRRGLERLAAGDVAAAQADLQRACDLDQLRFRADSKINAIVREVGAGAPGVTLVDAEQAFAAAGPPGADRFHEHVHFTFAGDHALAALVADAWSDLARRPRPDVAPAEVAAALAYTAADEARVLGEMAAMTARPPFTGQAGHAEDQARRRAAVGEARARARGAGVLGRAQYAAALQARPDDLRLRLNHARFLKDHGAAPAEVARAWAWVVQRMPDEADARVQLALARARSGEEAAGRRELEQLIRTQPGRAEPRKALADLALEAGRFEEAAAAYRGILEQHPDLAGARMNLGVACQRLGRLDEAERHYRAVLAAGPDPAALMNLGNVMVKQRRYADARPLFEAALAEGAAEASLFNNLGLALLAVGDFPAAARRLEQALALQPDHPRARPQLGEALARGGRVREGLAEFRRVLEKNFHPGAAAGVALALAAAPDAALRSPAEAEAIIQHVLNTTGARFAELAEAAAAAAAARGEYARAAELAGEAVGLFEADGRPALAELVRGRQARYRAGQPAWLPAEPEDGGRTSEGGGRATP